MDKDTLEIKLRTDYYCQICKNINIEHACDGCTAIIDAFEPDNNLPPTKFKNIYGSAKGEKEMIITIIGSYSKIEEMKNCKAYWERFGHKVNYPGDPEREELPLITKQSTWIEKIEEADLVVAIPKGIKIPGSGASSYVYEFGESTSYEMAIALRFKKQIVIW